MALKTLIFFPQCTPELVFLWQNRKTASTLLELSEADYQVYPAHGFANRTVALIFLSFSQFSLINQTVVAVRASPFYRCTYLNICPLVPGYAHQSPFAYILNYVYPHSRDDILAPGHSQAGVLLPSGTHNCQWGC